jgi:dihydropteroate synthase
LRNPTTCCPAEGGRSDLVCGRFRLNLGNGPLLMGILNVTPDSFSDGGRYFTPRKALARALQMQDEGADLIDVGGESTRPGARRVSASEEMRRVLPVLERVAGRLKIPVSVDTSKAKVAQAALRCGAAMINDVTALKDPRMAQVLAGAKVPVILMHMRGTPRTMQKNPRYRRLIPEIVSELEDAISKALSAGIPRDRILIDPGLGFGKRPQDNWVLLNQLSVFKALGFPVVIGPSRKSFIGRLLDLPVEERLFGTAAAVALGVANGADIVRVHDVAAMRQVARVAHAVVRANGFS